MNAALRAEATKLRRSPVGLIATVALVGGTIAVLGGITAAVAGGDPAMIAKAGPAAALDWTGLLSGAGQVTAAAGMLGCGTVLAWLFAREFTDGTIVGLFALPVTRGRIALAKLAVYACWVALVGVALTSGLLALGLALGYGAPDRAVWAGLARLCVLVLLTGAVTTPVALAATAARSLLAGVGCTVGLVVVAQVGALAGAGGWMPLAAPALWAASGGTAVTTPQLALAVAVGAAAAAAAWWTWSRLTCRR
ncbi:ABC transporter permease [Cellulomonas iranensis]|uniref:ABC-2 type transport system permease protein n=1 Tax=Cellulomonas iranensis TaxID=76862 RepID=A0ABU0GJW9_9CELL|nr:ABC transporter permease [Cellulomonas iranensis]MDQ0425637.1 ABC-2 type transport system permease protein [Cellulomonas iranensis]